MTYTLYYSPGAASMAVHWMLIEAQIPFETRLVDIDTGAQHSAEYLRLNPAGRVPTLIVDGVHAPRVRRLVDAAGRASSCCRPCAGTWLLRSRRVARVDGGLCQHGAAGDARLVLRRQRRRSVRRASGSGACDAAYRRGMGPPRCTACRRPTLPRRRKTQHRRFSRGDAHALNAQHASQGNEPGEPYAVHQPLTRFAVVHRTRCQRRTDRLEQSGELKVSSGSRALYQSCCAEPAVPIL
jgi:hypothetical protein